VIRRRPPRPTLATWRSKTCESGSLSEWSPRTSRSAQLLLGSANIESLDGLLLTIAVPSEEMRQNTEIIAQGLKGALEHEFKSPLTIYLDR